MPRKITAIRISSRPPNLRGECDEILPISRGIPGISPKSRRWKRRFYIKKRGQTPVGSAVRKRRGGDGGNAVWKRRVETSGKTPRRKSPTSVFRTISLRTVEGLFGSLNKGNNEEPSPLVWGGEHMGERLFCSGLQLFDMFKNSFRFGRHNNSDWKDKPFLAR